MKNGVAEGVASDPHEPIAGPLKHQKLTNSKIKYGHFGPKILIPYWKMDILVPQYFKKLNFLKA